MNYITTEQKNVLGFSANRKRKSKHYIDLHNICKSARFLERSYTTLGRAPNHKFTGFSCSYKSCLTT